MGFNCLKTTGPLRGDNLLFITKLRIADTHVIVHRKLKGPWSHPVALKLESLGSELHPLTTRPLFLK